MKGSRQVVFKIKCRHSNYSSLMSGMKRLSIIYLEKIEYMKLIVEDYNVSCSWGSGEGDLEIFFRRTIFISIGAARAFV